MNFSSITTFCHFQLLSILNNSDIAIDATAGNGNDIAFMAERVGVKGRIYGFDIQEEALTSTKKLVHDLKLSNQVELFLADHKKMSDYIPAEYHGKVKLIMFNLGYLPGGNHKLTTNYKSTIEALNISLGLIVKGGVVSVMIYPGHPEGKIEAEKIEAWSSLLLDKQFTVAQYKLINHKKNAPIILFIQRK